MNKIYENENGVRLEVIEDNYKDELGNVYTTWKFTDSDRSYCVMKDSFKSMLKANKYKEMN